MLKLNKEDLKKLNELFYEKDDNIFLVDSLNEYLSIHPSLKEDINFNDLESSFSEALFSYIGLDLEDVYTFKKIKEYELDKIKKTDLNLIKLNPYFKEVKPKEIKEDNIHLYYKKYDEYEAFLSEEIKIKKEFKEINSLSFFTESVNFLALDKNDETWMSISPHEINSMSKDILKANGDVLVLGLGLGYFLYMISLKDEVKKIRVIEKDKKIIKIFNKYIFPFFKNKNKIEIVEADALEEIKSKKHYDFIYVDIYHNAIDGLPLYFSLIKFDVDNNMHFWIEESILAYFRRFILTLFYEEIIKVDEKIYLNKAKDFDSKLINFLYKYLKNIFFNNIEEVKLFLKDESLKKLAKKVNL